MIFWKIFMIFADFPRVTAEILPGLPLYLPLGEGIGGRSMTAPTRAMHQYHVIARAGRPAAISRYNFTAT
jgi:hypothetical protein